MDLSDTGGGNMSLGAEIVYGTHEDSHVVMSQKVQSLAGSIYQEFERMISRYDEDVVKTLMPLLVNVLECLDSAYQQNQEYEVELELLREDNEQLVTQYEREKGAKKTAEQKLLEIEDAAEGERKELSSRLEALESIVRMLELKNKNSMEHASRLEEREGELKKEYAKLHERYTDLFKTHVDYMERTKLLHSGQQLANERSETNRLNSNRLNIGRSSGPVSFGFASLENADETVDSIPSSPISSAHSSPSEINNIPLKVERAQETDSVSLANKSVVTSPISPPPPPPPNNNHSNHTSSGRIHTKKEQRSANTLYQELSFQDVDGDGDDDSGDITGGWVHPGDYASSVNDNFYGMGKEVENLIMENNELLATKNALNVVKDDLIVKVDELTGEIDMLREEILTLNVSRTRLHEKVLSLEEELKKLKEENVAKQDADEEADVLMAQRKRFTRIEMAHVLMERNQYKESFMELQEAVRWTQMLRASKEPQLDKQGGIWGFFQNLFIRKERAHRSLAMPQLSYQVASNQITPGLKPFGRTQDRGEIELGGDRYTAMRRALERREQYRQVRAHVKKDDGRLHAYGWSLPGKVPNPHSMEKLESSGRSSGGGSGIPVPVPVYCRPLAETTPEMRIWCAAGVNLMGGYTKDGGLMVGGSVFYSDNTEMSTNNIRNQSEETEIESIDRELKNFKDGALLETRLSSLVWICTTTRQASIVTVIDANNPGELLNSFGVCSAQILCIASVPGASPSDYIDDQKQITYEKWDPNVAPHLESTESNPISEEKSSETNQSNNKTTRQLEEQQESIALGKIFFVEKNDTVVNKKDKYKMMYEESLNEEKEKQSNEENNVNTETENVDNENKEETASRNSTDNNMNPNLDIMSSVLATMWIGDERGNVYVHSSVANWAQRLHTVKLQDAVISIVHVNGRTVVALANSQLVIFKRNTEGEWDLSQYFIVQIGLPTHSVRQLAVVGDKVWCGYRNKIHVLEPRELKIIHSLEAHPRRESPVRQMAWLGEGVWVSIRLDSTLRLYNAHTYEHLQDVDIEPYVSKMLGTGKLGFSLVRITSLLISSNRLWIGTSNGVIISVPLNASSSYNLSGSIMSRTTNLPGACVRIPPMPGSYIPYCSMAHAQLSFHGHRDCVKFFVAVPGNGGVSAASTPSEAMYASSSASTAGGGDGPLIPPKSMLVISGGEGYVDFRIGDQDIEESIAKYTQPLDAPADDAPSGNANQEINQRDLSHLIVWQVITN